MFMGRGTYGIALMMCVYWHTCMHLMYVHGTYLQEQIADTFSKVLELHCMLNTGNLQET